MQEMVDRLSNEVALLRVQVEFYKKEVERKNRFLKLAKEAFSEIVDDESKFKEYWF